MKKPEYNQQIIDLHNMGMKNHEIRDKLGLTTGIVSGVLNRHRALLIKHTDLSHHAKAPTVAKTNKPTLPNNPKQCLWLGGKPNEHECCSAERLPGKPYCADHMAACYVKGAAGKYNRKLSSTNGLGYATHLDSAMIQPDFDEAA